MNQEENCTNLPAFRLTADQEQEIMKMAAVGSSPSEIAAALELEPRKALLFVMLASTPVSNVAALIRAGKAIGKVQPLMKLQEAATAGNVEAVRTLRQIQKENRMLQLLTAMDDDELAE